MSCPLKISESAALALHAMVYFVSHPDQIVSTKDLAKLLDASVGHLSKVLQRLSRMGFLKALRGPGGGFTLDKVAENLTLKDVYTSVEGPITWSNCLFNHPVCRKGECIMGSILRDINGKITDYFENTTLKDVAGRSWLKSVDAKEVRG